MMEIKYTEKQTPTYHRRALSESFSIDEIFLDDDVVLPPTGPPKKMGGADVSHLRSLSVDADFFDGLALDGPVLSGRKKYGHRHSNSMDDYSSVNTSFDRKGVGADRLAELSLIDPKRAKRILANRQSAARSKERKVRYTGELERKLQTIQTEATTLSAQITLLQKDTSGLTSENKELRLKLEALEQQAHLKDALNEALRNEVQRLKIAAGEIPADNGNNRGLSSQSPTFSHYFGNQNQQQMQQNQTQQPNNSQARGQSPLPFRDFNQRGG